MPSGKRCPSNTPDTDHDCLAAISRFWEEIEDGEGHSRESATAETPSPVEHPEVLITHRHGDYGYDRFDWEKERFPVPVKLPHRLRAMVSDALDSVLEDINRLYFSRHYRACKASQGVDVSLDNPAMWIEVHIYYHEAIQLAPWAERDLNQEVGPSRAKGEPPVSWAETLDDLRADVIVRLRQLLAGTPRDEIPAGCHHRYADFAHALKRLEG